MKKKPVFPIFIFSALTGGKTSGLNLNGILSAVGGLDQNQDGKVNMDDLTAMISGAAKGQQQDGGAGILGALKGMFGK